MEQPLGLQLVIPLAILNSFIVYKYYKIHWLNSIWIKIVILFIAMLAIHHFVPYFGNVWLNIFIRSIALVSLFAGLVFGLKLSEDLNNTLIQLVKGKFRWF